MLQLKPKPMRLTKLLLLIQLLFCLPLFVAAQMPAGGKFILRGTVKGIAPKQISIGYLDNLGKRHSDSTGVKEGRFTFSGVINGPTLAHLAGAVTSRLMDDPNITAIYLEPGIMEIELTVNDFQSAMVKGSRTQSDYQKLNEQERPLTIEKLAVVRAMDSVNKKMSLQGKSAALQTQMDSLNIRWAKWANSVTAIRHQFVKVNGNSAITAYLIPGLISDNEIALDSATAIYNNFPPFVKNSALGLEVKTTIAAKRALITGVIGKKAPALNGTDINGNTLRSEDYIGKKYLLLDFWFTMCMPCHDAFPYLNNLYDKYSEAGLEIIGVSIDNDKALWEKDIAKSKIGRWKHMLAADDQIKELGKKVNDRFYIQAYPTVILIDKSGVIVYRSEGFDANEKKKLDAFIHSSL
jgi:peroxiredoxin